MFACLAWYASANYSRSQETAPLPKHLPIRTLIVSGGPTAHYTQYAIESNARYLQQLTSPGKSQNILFADGSTKSHTVSVYEYPEDSQERRVIEWLLGKEVEGIYYTEVFKPPTLRPIHGPATGASVTKSLTRLSEQVRPGEIGLVYFTGHGGNPKTERKWAFWNRIRGSGSDYSLWGNKALAVPTVAQALKSWPKAIPLTVVMVQCHSGGFTDLMFQNGDPERPLLDRDFSGFFASTADRQSSGCTSEVDEKDYDDFTTHFFAALSGRTRYGTRLTGADYDKDGRVSMSEAYAWAVVHDDSIDVPVCTSDAYLRSLYEDRGDLWLGTSYSALLKDVTPWQRAIFDGLSEKLGLKGEQRLKQAWEGHQEIAPAVHGHQASPERDWDAVLGQDSQRIYASFIELERGIKRRFPALRGKPNSPAFKNAMPKAVQWIRQRPMQFKLMASAMKRFDDDAYRDVVREAQYWRFLRSARTIMLERRLAKEGTPAQKAAMARFRKAEARNPLLP